MILNSPYTDVERFPQVCFLVAWLLSPCSFQEVEKWKQSTKGGNQGDAGEVNDNSFVMG